MKTRILTLTVLLFITAIAFAYDVQIDGIYYNLNHENKTANVTNNGNRGSYSGDIIIPSNITDNNETYIVTSITSYAFYYCRKLNSIIIPSTISEIGSDAFQWCTSLTSITIPNGVSKIEDRVFVSCLSLTSIVIPEGVTYIGDNAFTGCSNLSSISIPNSVTHIGNGAFSSCLSLNSITIPNSVTFIGENAFSNTPWLNNQSDGCIYINNSFYAYKGEMPENTHIDVKEGTTMICASAFSGCSSLTSITIPNSVTYIGGYAFTECSSLTFINVDKNNQNYASIDGVLFNKNINSLICCPAGKKTEVIIPNSVTSIEDFAFYGCSSLTSIEIPNSITSIGFCAFSGCSSLTSITMQTITLLTIEKCTFEDVPRSVEIKIPCGSINSYKTAEYWNEFVNYVENPLLLTVTSNDDTMGFATVTKRNSCDDNVAQVQAQALPNYKFVRWSDGSTENPHIVLVTEDMTITAEFAKEGEEPEKKHNNFIVESADATQGSVIITITAQAIEGFEFSHWSDGSTENPRNITLDKDIELYAHFQIKGTSTGLENSVISSANVYSSNGRLHVEGAETDYYVLDMAGRLIYSGRDTEVQLPRGVYLVTIKGEVQKIVL